MLLATHFIRLKSKFGGSVGTGKEKISQIKQNEFPHLVPKSGSHTYSSIIDQYDLLCNGKEPVEYIEIKTNPGMVAALDLPDGSKVWLNSGSYLKHPKHFTGDIREVELNGEAYFSVHKDKSKRFIVNTPFDLKAEVLGTEFNMEAYRESNQVTTSLISGSVRLSFRNRENKEESFIMKPDDEISYNIKTKGIKTNTSYLPTQIAWKDGLVIFRNTSFEEALKVLSKRFNTEFIVKMIYCTKTLSPELSVDSILRLFSSTSGYHPAFNISL